MPPVGKREPTGGSTQRLSTGSAMDYVYVIDTYREAFKTQFVPMWENWA